MTGIRLTVNGEPVPLPSPCTVSELLDRLGLDRGRVAVDLNRRVVPRAEHDRARLADGDVLEIAEFTAGG